MQSKLLIAIVGMPGAGKSEVIKHIKNMGIVSFRFGQITDEGVSEKGLLLNPDNERIVREEFRKNFGMAIYAIKSEKKIKKLLENHDTVAIDGLYSWEEYIYLSQKFGKVVLVLVFADPPIRYKRLSQRAVRPIPINKTRERDIEELEKLNKGGPIAIADHVIINNDISLDTLHTEIENILKKIK